LSKSLETQSRSACRSARGLFCVQAICEWRIVRRPCASSVPIGPKVHRNHKS
jgi:hypothetical protein